MHLSRSDGQPSHASIFGLGNPAHSGDPGKPLAALIEIDQPQQFSLDFAGGWGHDAVLAQGSYQPHLEKPSPGAVHFRGISAKCWCTTRHCPIPIGCLHQSACGFGALALQGLLAATAQAEPSGPLAPRPPHFPATAKRVVFLFMHGGVSHVDSFDPKPKLNINTGSGVFARPSLGAWTLYGLGSENQSLPGVISLSPSLYHGGAQNYGSAFLPATFQGTRPGDGDTHFREARLSGLAPGQHPALQRLQSAYGIGVEPTDEFGRQCLLARRCLEAGVRFVQVNFSDPRNYWDAHGNLRNNHTTNAARVDLPIAALLRDLKSRGLSDAELNHARVVSELFAV